MSESQKKKQSIKECQLSLPIYPFKQSLIEAVEQFQVLIIEGETGSGKTTQVPQYLHDAVRNYIFCVLYPYPYNNGKYAAYDFENIKSKNLNSS